MAKDKENTVTNSNKNNLEQVIDLVRSVRNNGWTSKPKQALKNTSKKFTLTRIRPC